MTQKEVEVKQMPKFDVDKFDVDKFDVDNNQDEGTLQIKTDSQVDLVLLPVLENLAVSIRGLSKGFVRSMKELVMIAQSLQNYFLRVPKVKQPEEKAEIPELTSIKGVGLRRAEDLSGIGIESVDDLAKADPSTIYEQIGGVGLTEEDISKWIEKAKELIESS